MGFGVTGGGGSIDGSACPANYDWSLKAEFITS